MNGARCGSGDICRIISVSLKWLSSCLKKKSEIIQLEVHLVPKKGQISVECDEIWTSIQNQTNVPWLGLVIDRLTKMMVGFCLGVWDSQTDRSLFSFLDT